MGEKKKSNLGGKLPRLLLAVACLAISGLNWGAYKAKAASAPVILEALEAVKPGNC